MPQKSLCALKLVDNCIILTNLKKKLFLLFRKTNKIVLKFADNIGIIKSKDKFYRKFTYGVHI